MSLYKNNLINNLDLSSKSKSTTQHKGSPEEVFENMADPRYLRQSSALINDALQKGFDVLQLADGDIVMTGVKTVVYQYTWSAKEGKLVRSKASKQKPQTAMAKPKVNVDEADDDELAEQEAQEEVKAEDA